MIFSSLWVKYPFGFQKLFVLAGDWGMRKKERMPMRTGPTLALLALS